MTNPMRTIIVIELAITDPIQIPEAINAINPMSIPHFAGNLRVALDGFPDSPATAIINFLEGEGEEVG